MRIVGVIDLRGGRAVHAKGGCRQSYRPVDTVAGQPVLGDAEALARVYVDHLGLDELYVADLDAIAGGAEQDEAVRRVAAGGVPVWLDAGVTTVAQARRALARGASRVIVGLETLPSFGALHEIVCVSGANSVAFSLDLRDGRPIGADAVCAGGRVELIASQAVVAGVNAIIVLDLARVGTARGLDLAVLERVRRAVPTTTLLAGGGVRSADDLSQLSSVGCDGALVATALHGAGAADFLRAARRVHE